MNSISSLNTTNKSKDWVDYGFDVYVGRKISWEDGGGFVVRIGEEAIGYVFMVREDHVSMDKAVWHYVHFEPYSNTFTPFDSKRNAVYALVKMHLSLEV